jgi:hypothetical protein
VWTSTAGAQRVATGLSAEAQKYVGQDPGEALRALTSQLARPRANDIAHCPAIPPDGLDGLTNGHYFFLSEIGGCDKLACFLKQAATSAHAASTLIVDQTCSGAHAIRETLVLPDRFTLAGVGIDGTGVLAFDLPDNVPAIRFADSSSVVNRMATIRDLNLAGECCGQTGIDVSDSQFVYIRNVRVQNFAIGLFGTRAWSIFVEGSSLHNNAYNIVLGDDTTTWRVRDTVANQGLIGIQINATGRGHLVSGGRVESNWGPGIRVDGAMNVIESTWFEGNGQFFNTNYGVWVTGQGLKNRILSSLFSSQLIGDGGVETRTCFNMSFAAGSADVNEC